MHFFTRLGQFEAHSLSRLIVLRHCATNLHILKVPLSLQIDLITFSVFLICDIFIFLLAKDFSERRQATSEESSDLTSASDLSLACYVFRSRKYSNLLLILLLNPYLVFYPSSWWEALCNERGRDSSCLRSVKSRNDRIQPRSAVIAIELTEQIAMISWRNLREGADSVRSLVPYFPLCWCRDDVTSSGLSVSVVLSPSLFTA